MHLRLVSVKRLHADMSTDGSWAGQTTTSLPDNQTNSRDPVDLEKPSLDDALSCSGRRRPKASSGDDSDVGYCQATRLRRKAKLVKSACAQCQKRKTKCSGKRPVCHSCNDRGVECFWNVGDGLTRTADLKDKLNKATQLFQDLDTLVDTMRYSTDQVSSMLLAKLRIGVSLEDLVTGIRLETTATDQGDLDAMEMKGPIHNRPRPSLSMVRTLKGTLCG